MITNWSKRFFAALFIVLAVNLSSFASQQSVAAPIAILGIPEETEALLAQLTNQREVKIQGLTFIVGELRGKRVVLARVGFGKVNAALAATLLIEHFKPEGLIFTGAAGALDPLLIPGDVVIGTNTTEHDFGMLTDKRQARPRVSLTGAHAIPSLTKKIRSFSRRIADCCWQPRELEKSSGSNGWSPTPR